MLWIIYIKGLKPMSTAIDLHQLQNVSLSHLFPELKARKKQVFNGGGDDEQGAPRLHAHPCPRMHPLYNTQVAKSSKCSHKTKNTSISIEPQEYSGPRPPVRNLLTG